MSAQLPSPHLTLPFLLTTLGVLAGLACAAGLVRDTPELMLAGALLALLTALGLSRALTLSPTDSPPSAPTSPKEISMHYLLAFLLVGLGVLGGMAMVAGEVDDAPGLILIGMLLALGAALACARKLRIRTPV